MQLQNLPFLGFGYSPWGIGTSGAANGGATSGGSAGTPGTSVAGSGGASSASSSGGTSTGGSASDASSIGSSLSNAISSALGGSLGNGVTASASELAVVRESETLKIQMTDGTQVTIRLRAQGAAFGTTQTQGDGSSSAAAAIFSSGQLQVSVSGNLSSADQQAISNVVSQVNSLATQFFSGDVQDAFAAAASLNVDPTEIAGFSLKLSYSGTEIQQAAASAPASSTSPPANTTASASSSSPSATDASSAPAGNTPSPQQIIINFVQKVMTTLGRSSTTGSSQSQLSTSSRWKLQLFAQALPAYAQAQAGAASQAARPQDAASAASQGTIPAGTDQSVTPALAAAPQSGTNRYPTLQAAQLAADTMSQLAQ